MNKKVVAVIDMRAVGFAGTLRASELKSFAVFLVHE